MRQILYNTVRLLLVMLKLLKALLFFFRRKNALVELHFFSILCSWQWPQRGLTNCDRERWFSQNQQRWAYLKCLPDFLIFTQHLLMIFPNFCEILTLFFRPRKTITKSLGKNKNKNWRHILLTSVPRFMEIVQAVKKLNSIA